jgi:hypothetical protein
MLLAMLVDGVAAGVVVQVCRRVRNFVLKEEVVYRERKPRELFCYVSGKFECVRGCFREW